MKPQIVMMFMQRATLLLTVVVPIPLCGQKSKTNDGIEKHGTCAITATAPFGAAFIIDSRVTVLGREGEIVSQFVGCKAKLARPSVLIAGIGLEDTTGRAGHWNSLDEASSALNNLPEHPTLSQLKQWSYLWGDTLISHFKNGNERPRDVGEVADILLLTNIEGNVYYQRSTVEWDGAQFTKYIYGQDIDWSIPQVNYAGACRDFAFVNDGEGHILRPKFPRTPAEQQRFNYWGKRKMTSKSVNDLADVVYGLESVSTDIDTRLEGNKAVIAAPYAAAVWNQSEQRWMVDLNPECKAASAK